jgi:hypothetical protein
MEEYGKDEYSNYDNFVVNEPWTWAPQHLHIAERSKQTGFSRDELAEEASSSDQDASYKGQRNSRGRRRKNHARRVLPLTAGLFEEVPAAVPRTLDIEQRVTELKDEVLVLLYPLTFGFSLKAKKWSKSPTIDFQNEGWANIVEIDATLLEEVERSTKSFDNLVLNPESLKVLEAIIKRLDKQDTSWSADFIEGKGTGGMILLHGNLHWFTFLNHRLIFHRAPRCRKNIYCRYEGTQLRIYENRADNIVQRL